MELFLLWILFQYLIQFLYQFLFRFVVQFLFRLWVSLSMFCLFVFCWLRCNCIKYWFCSFVVCSLIYWLWLVSVWPLASGCNYFWSALVFCHYFGWYCYHFCLFFFCVVGVFFVRSGCVVFFCFCDVVCWLF